MLQHATDNSLIIDGRDTGLKLTQRHDGTVVYTPENRLRGQEYKQHQMPHKRYSVVHDAPASGAAGRSQLEEDLRALLDSLKN
ncbi:MAG: hypothetical protein RIQ53_2672 [Pseudomonadota bacterium]|jgi:hypothetical protein